MQIPRTIIADADDDCLQHNCNHKFACSQNLNCGRRLLEISLSKVFPHCPPPSARVFLIFPYHCIFVFLYFSPALDMALKVRSGGRRQCLDRPSISITFARDGAAAGVGAVAIDVFLCAPSSLFGCVFLRYVLHKFMQSASRRESKRERASNRCRLSRTQRK